MTQFVFTLKKPESHQASELNQAMAVVLRLGDIPNFQIGADGKSIVPQLTPESNQTAYQLFVMCATLKFRNSLTKNQVFELTTTIYHLKNG